LMPIDASEKFVVDGIDGRRTIAELGANADLFERLWCHDQVVFDAYV
jgi:hypothetical protein